MSSEKKKVCSARNKTISCTIEEGQSYLTKCMTEEQISKLVPNLYQLYNQTIIGDFFQIAPQLPKKFVDLMIVDPPYNLTKQYHGNTFTKKKMIDYEAYTRQWLSQTIPLLKENASVYVCCDWESSLVIGRVLGEFLQVRNRITWQREKGRGATANWKNSMEDIWFATYSDTYTFHTDAVKQRRKVLAPYRVEGVPKDWQEDGTQRYRDTYPSNFWDDITIPFWSMPENTAHPTQKPEKLIAKLILASSNPGDLVFDPFLGSGTTSVVAKKLERQYLGIEQNPQYAIWTQMRLERAESEPKIQGYEDGVFWERNSLAAQKAKSCIDKQNHV